MSLTTKVLLIGTPALYLMGVVGVGSMYWTHGAPTVMDAILFGVQWPLYIGHFVS